MLSFKPLKLEDKPLVDRCLADQNYRTADLCFTNLYAWGGRFDTQCCYQNGWFFVRFRDNNNCTAYLKPIGTGDLKEAIDLIIEDQKAYQSCFRLRGLTSEMVEEVEAAMPDTFLYQLNLSVSDYIYSSEKLINLTGKKLQSKRNHINRFQRENRWKYYSLREHEELIKECREMLDRWINEREEEDPSLVHDDLATTIMLDNFDYLGLIGGAIKVEDEIVAFTLGERLTKDTAVVHVEKAVETIHGAYSIINQQFVENDLYQFDYINREEDMGIPNLRKAKSSYHPDILLKKYNARFKNP